MKPYRNPLDTATSLNLLERVRLSMQSSDDYAKSVTADLNLIISVLENPVFKGILTVQDSLNQVN